jgi:NadR type nicotinamide-nucleotide adenylyltransferase
LVIGRAFDLCDEVILISYSNPELPGCGAGRREQWLTALFPRARTLVVTNERLRQLLPNSPAGVVIPPDDADNSTHRHFTGFLCREILGVAVDAVFTSEDYGDGFAAELTAYFRRHDPSATAVRHELVDRDRKQVPISGTLIRANPDEQRRWLSPIVYASFVRRVCILGGESSGKSTLAQALANHFGTLHVPEYGRELWEQKNGALAYEDLLRIAERQVAAEEQALFRANRFLVCDTSPLTTLFYSQHLFNRADPKLEQLADRQYDLVVLCGTDFDFVQDGTRRDAAFRDRQHNWYLAELARRNIPFSVATGSVKSRVEQVVKRLQGLLH